MRLLNSGIVVQVIYTNPWLSEVKNASHVDLPFPLGVKVRGIFLFNKLFIQFVWRSWMGADLIIVEHANKNLLNYFLMALSFLRIKTLGFWGHGYSSQANPRSIGEFFKRKSLHLCDWWFAYTKRTAEYLSEKKYPEVNTTIVENSIDTRRMKERIIAINSSEVNKEMNALNLDQQNKIAIFCSNLYPNKRLDLLFESADLIYAKEPMFRLLIIGGGVMYESVKIWASSRSWVKYLGPIFDDKKFVYFRMSSIYLSPGVLGLGVLDAFCSGLPVIVTNIPGHGPEVSYLNNNINSIIVEPESNAFADAVIFLLKNPDTLNVLKNNAFASSNAYSISNMIENFAQGIEQCLGQ